MFRTLAKQCMSMGLAVLLVLSPLPLEAQQSAPAAPAAQGAPGDTPDKEHRYLRMSCSNWLRP
jgi:hypothetical protein